MTITVQETDNLDRIDKFITAKLPNLSRSFLQKQIKEGDVTVNGKTVKAHFRPQIGDVIEIAQTEREQPRIEPNSTVAFDVVDENDEYIVISKPAGLVVHPAEGVHEPTLADGLVAKYPEIADVGESALRPGIVHRLDRDVSGLMVIARTQKMFNNLKQQFQERSIDKEYTALAHGIIDEPSGEINTPIGRSLTKSGKMAAHPHSPKDTEDAYQKNASDREAKTMFEVIERMKNYTLLKIKILTGRSHQIRVHLNSIGHPVVGDALYRNKKIKQPNLNRLFLHASKLAFDDLQGMRKQYESGLPEELTNFLSSL